MLLLADSKCYLTTLITRACNNTDVQEEEVWEFLPKKGYLSDPIKFDINIGDKSDVISIIYNENNVNVNSLKYLIKIKVDYIIAGKYN